MIGKRLWPRTMPDDRAPALEEAPLGD